MRNIESVKQHGNPFSNVCVLLVLVVVLLMDILFGNEARHVVRKGLVHLSWC